MSAAVEPREGEPPDTETPDIEEALAEGETSEVTRVVIGLLGLVGGVGYLVVALGLSRGSLDRPGPGAFPQLVGVLIVLASALVVWESRKALSQVLQRHPLPPVAWFVFLGAVAVAAALMPVIGFAPASFVLALIILRTVGRLGWVKAVVIAVAIAVVTDVVFVRVFGVYLPSIPFLEV